MTNFNKGRFDHIDYDDQSTLEPGTERVRHFRFRAHEQELSRNRSGNDPKIMTHLFDDARTLLEAMQRGLKQSNNGRCLGWRPSETGPYEWLSYSQVLDRAARFGRGIRQLGLDEKACVGIYSKNRLECVTVEYGLYHYSMANVPLYDTLGPHACRHIIEQAELSVVVCEDDKKMNSLMDSAPPCLTKLICMTPFKQQTVQRAEKMGIKILGISQVEEMGQKQLDDPNTKDACPFKFPISDDVCTICYTSGTTGDLPKGAILTHGNFIATASSILLQVSAPEPLNCNDCSISFLPLAHVYERETHAGMLMAGGSIGYYRGDILKLVDDIQALQPTFLPCVPRLLNRIYDKIMNSAKDSYIKRLMVEMALKGKGKELQRGIVRKNSIWDKLVFGKIQKLFGGRIRFIVSSAAPISEDVLNFFRCAMGCEVLECYGQTEASGSITATRLGDYSTGHLGPAHPCCAVKLVDVPEMNYFSKNDCGEICIKGANVFKGYLKNSEETEKVFDSDGWFHTGDVGLWLPNGTLRIIDRKKNILKLSQGEYVAPEKIEGIYVRSPYVAQIFVYGDPLKSSLVGIVVPDFEVLKGFIVDGKGCNEKICMDDQVKVMILQDLVKTGKTHGLKSFEQVKDICLHAEPFSIENGLLTPTLKSKRHFLQKHFKTLLDEMYSKLR